MSFSNSTTNLHLPQYSQNDKPTYLGDFNQAMLDIDTGYASNKALAESADTKATSALADSQSALSTAQSASSTATEAITASSQASSKADTALNNSQNANTKADTAISGLNNLETEFTNKETLSTTPKVVGFDEDNKPIYRKVLKGTVNISVSNLTLDNLPNIKNIRFNGTLYVPAEGTYNIPAYINSNDYTFLKYSLNNNIELHLGYNWRTNTHYYIIVDYTLTTD